MSQHPLKQGDGLVHLPELCFCLLQLGGTGWWVEDRAGDRPQTPTKTEGRVGKAGEGHGQGVVQGLWWWVPSAQQPLHQHALLFHHLWGFVFSQSGQSPRTQEPEPRGPVAAPPGGEQVRRTDSQATLSRGMLPQGSWEKGQSRQAPQQPPCALLAYPGLPAPAWRTPCSRGQTGRMGYKEPGREAGYLLWVCLSSPCHAPAQQVPTCSGAWALSPVDCLGLSRAQTRTGSERRGVGRTHPPTPHTLASSASWTLRGTLTG